MDHPVVINEVELRILRLLFEGLGEAAIGRRLGLGHRTVQRKMRGLMLRWRVKGRVALGARAHELGLLPSGAGLHESAVTGPDMVREDREARTV
ncbi:LuxR C-terminal-related transcriptional regulator [Streptomyces sp. NPDC045251]|uniref:LuxR C-terminal-related transcriptional regulator n=1 Tax=unclassified Streptomyces TaxID=2593676 RepID=UPI0033F03442